jgi:hypothetical protein
MIRLRQVALVATDLEPAVDALCAAFGLTVCFRDPGVAEFGLHNALMTVGDQFLEVVSPADPGTTAGRLLDKRGGDGGYMAIFEVDDLDTREHHWHRIGARVVWRGDFEHLTPGIRGRHLHPRDVGGAIVSLDQPEPPGSWRWAGPAWTAHTDTSVVTGIAGVVISAERPDTMRARWREVGVDHAVAFTVAGTRGEGLDEVHLVATDRERAGEALVLCGVTFRLV